MNTRFSRKNGVPEANDDLLHKVDLIIPVRDELTDKGQNIEVGRKELCQHQGRNEKLLI